MHIAHHAGTLRDCVRWGGPLQLFCSSGGSDKVYELTMWQGTSDSGNLLYALMSQHGRRSSYNNFYARHTIGHEGTNFWGQLSCHGVFHQIAPLNTLAFSLIVQKITSRGYRLDRSGRGEAPHAQAVCAHFVNLTNQGNQQLGPVPSTVLRNSNGDIIRDPQITAEAETPPQRKTTRSMEF